VPAILLSASAEFIGGQPPNIFNISDSDQRVKMSPLYQPAAYILRSEVYDGMPTFISWHNQVQCCL
jgi:hypothetical protein